MANPEAEVWRVIINWLIPTSLAVAVIKVATKMLNKDVTWTGAILTSIISILMGVVVGAIVYFVSDIWQALIATSMASLLGERLGHWFVYDFEIDKALNSLMRVILTWLKKPFK